MVNRENFDSVVDYNTVLDNFEGPLDLLLYLIKAEEIDIKDIFVSQVTEQFLGYMKGLSLLDVDKVSEYLNIAAMILKIKAQSLVPNLEEDPEAAAELEEDKTTLIRALEEYRLIKEETKKLKELETVGYFFKEPDKNVGETKTVFSLDSLTLDGLVYAFSVVMLKKEQAENDRYDEKEIPRDEFTVPQKLHAILDTLSAKKQITFGELFDRDFTKGEVVTTFQALLELLKYQYVRVSQAQPFGEITISANPDRGEEDYLGKIDEYD